LSALAQSIGRLKSALTTVLICALSLAACLNQATAQDLSIAVADLPQNLSPWGMFQHADQIVKAVMIGLAVASLVTWTIWVAKSIELFGARAAVRRGLRLLSESTTLAQANEKLRSGKGPVAQLMQAAVSEIRLSANQRADSLKERIAWQSERIEMAAGRTISRGTGILATIGASPIRARAQCRGDFLTDADRASRLRPNKIQRQDRKPRPLRTCSQSERRRV
jgi:biopolymer transport protein ExbB